MPPFPLPRGRSGLKYIFAGFWNKIVWKIRSYPIIPVFIVALIGLGVSLIGFLLLNQDFPAALSFGVTASALVVGLLIFAIQTYPLLRFSLTLSTKNRGDKIYFNLNIENVGIAACEVEVTFDNLLPVGLISHNKMYKTDESDAMDGSTPYLIPKNQFASIPVLSCSECSVDEAKRLNKYPNFSIQIRPHGFIYKHIIGATRIIFTNEEIQKALNKVISNSFLKDESVTIWDHKYSYSGIPQKGGSARYNNFRH